MTDVGTSGAAALEVQSVACPTPAGAVSCAAEADERATGDPSLHDIVASGSVDKLNDAFAERGWSDGLPIIPPTRDRVERFLTGTGLDPRQSAGHHPHHRQEHDRVVSGDERRRWSLSTFDREPDA